MERSLQSARVAALEGLHEWMREHESEWIKQCWSPQCNLICILNKGNGIWQAESEYVPARVTPHKMPANCYEIAWLTDDIFAALQFSRVQQPRGNVSLFIADHTERVCDCSVTSSYKITAAVVDEGVYRIAHAGLHSICVRELTTIGAGNHFEFRHANGYIDPLKWSPDGKSLFAFNERIGSLHVYTDFVFTGKKACTTRVFPNICGQYLAWSPDSTRVAVYNRNLSEMRIVFIFQNKVCVVPVPETMSRVTCIYWLKNETIMCVCANARIVYLHGPNYDTFASTRKPIIACACVTFAICLHPSQKALLLSAPGHGAWMYHFSDWTDRTHYLFPLPFRRLVFTLMCVKERLFQQPKKRQILPTLPMHVWLLVFTFLVELPLHLSFVNPPAVKVGFMAKICSRFKLK